MADQKTISHNFKVLNELQKECNQWNLKACIIIALDYEGKPSVLYSPDVFNNSQEAYQIIRMSENEFQ